MVNPSNSGSGADSDYLSGWKEIAGYLRKGVRTVQRWERVHGLPVHRVGTDSEIVFARRAELDLWLDSFSRVARPDNARTLQHCLLWHGRTFLLPEGETVLGRATDVDVQILLPSVSRRHARISIRGAEATLEDLESTHGTWCGSVKLKATVPLASGDEIRLGTAGIVYRLVRPEDTTA